MNANGLNKFTGTAAAVILMLTAGASWAQELTRARIPVRVNVAANVSIQPPNAAAGTGAEKTVEANVWDTLDIMIALPQTSVSHVARRHGVAPASARYNRGNVLIELHPQQYGNAAVTLHSINGRRILGGNAAASASALNISRNVAPGVYLLSVRGVNGNAFSTRLAHRGGMLNINAAFAGASVGALDVNGIPSLRRDAAAMSDDADSVWTMTVSADEHLTHADTLTPVAGLNREQDITLAAIDQPPPPCTPGVDCESDIDSSGVDRLPRFVLPSAPTFGSGVSVHDPSIFKDDNGTYYTFGSHFAVASSTNLMRWTQVSGDFIGVNRHPTIFGQNPGWRTVLASAIAHVEADGNTTESAWAPDVIKLGNKYYMYYSLSTWGSNRSYIGRVEADNVTGPYSNSVEIVKTPLGSGSPNAIDPAFFYDKDGRLWMTYGSFFGGMFIMEMETSGARAGLPKTPVPENGRGTRICAGAGNAGPEGPYIFYNPDTDYYYLMVTYGSLSTDYNMRVMRSRNPDGPYSDTRNANVGTLSSTGSRDAGMKLAGNYRFAGASRGYGALGHNSVLVENGKYFCIYHTRYQDGTTGNNVTGNHNQFVSQLFFNADGWPVMAPNRYAGETAGRVDTADVAGEYDLIVHTAVGNDVTFAASSRYVFNANGTVTQNGQPRGAWALSGDYYLSVTLSGVVYSGVIVPQWINDVTPARAALSVTAISQAGVSLWANRRPG